MRRLLILFSVVVGLANPQAVEAVTVSASADISYYLSDAAGSASVTTYHLASLVEASGLELGLYTLGMDAAMFYNGGFLYNRRIWADATLVNHPGFLTWSWFHQGACLLIEGTYSGRTIGGAGPPPVFLASGVASTGPLILNCPPIMPDPPGPCESAIETTSTSVVSWGPADHGEGRGGLRAPIQFPLSRVERRGDETFVMDEWSIVSGGQVIRASSPEFADAVREEGDIASGDQLLFVQEPIHALNQRYTSKPVVRLVGGRELAPEQRGNGEVVVARLEFSTDATVDGWEVLYTSDPLDEAGIAELLTEKLSLAFASEKRHRTAVYVVFRLAERMELIDVVSALPQCCCGETICI